MNRLCAEFASDGFVMFLRQGPKNLCVLHCHTGHYTSAVGGVDTPLHPDGRPILTPMGRASLDIFLVKEQKEPDPVSITDLAGDGSFLEVSMVLESWQLPWLIEMQKLCQDKGQVLGLDASQMSEPIDGSLGFVVDGGDRVADHQMDLTFLASRKPNFILDREEAVATTETQDLV